METLLVTKADFADYVDLPESLDMARLRPHILAVQRTRIDRLLTGPLYDELVRQLGVATAEAPLPPAWAALLKMVVPVVCCAAMARYMPFAQNTAVSNGFAVKQSQHSQPSDGRDLARMATIYDGDALSFEVALSKWLQVAANVVPYADFYPATTCCGAAPAGRTPTVVVQAIRRPDDVPTPSPC